ncbi:hypothetical protein [Prauserella cavernicola]|uniref:Phage tail protein n=1 Tax=Prauserella cavernicola TaxID=2800127 RepID=A0A934QT11_9PSEU|nr:hypothetical protein [Prauserella cavernicola]MBK1785134.1 hypothetical protein [Prauserella cavernicola]
MSVHQRRLKLINFTVDGIAFECQIRSWTLDPGTQDGDRQYTYCSGSEEGDNSFIEETDDEPTLQLTAFSDWRSDGFSDFLWTHANQTVDFVLDHHPNLPEGKRWRGRVQIKPGPVGGDARTTEITEVTLPIVGTLGDGLYYEPMGAGA